METIKKRGLITSSTSLRYLQTPHNHKREDGCALCQESKMEKAVRKYLEDNKIAGLIPQFRLDDTRLKLDFYIQQINRNGENIKLGIECQGKQHIYPIKAFGGEPSLAKQKAWDAQKASICKNENMALEYILYNENVMQRIVEIVNKYALISEIPPQEDLS